MAYIPVPQPKTTPSAPPPSTNDPFSPNYVPTQSKSLRKNTNDPFSKNYVPSVVKPTLATQGSTNDPFSPNYRPSTPPPVRKPLTPAPTPDQGFFAPTPEVRARDVIREVPGAVKDVAIDIARSFPRAILKAGLSLAPEKMRDSIGAIDPSQDFGKTGEVLLGKQPIEDLQTSIAGTEQAIQESPTAQKYGLNKVALPLAVGGVMGGEFLDLIPGITVEKRALQTLVRSTDEAVVRNVLKDNMKLPDHIIDEIAPKIAATKKYPEIKSLVTDAMRRKGLPPLPKVTPQQAEKALQSLGDQNAPIPVPTPQSVPAALEEVNKRVQTAVPEKLTPYDTPEILKAREAQSAITPTHMITTPERAAFREKVVNDYYGSGAQTKGKRVDIVMGPPAAGKSSTLVEPLAKEHGAFIADSDAIKEMLPEFQGGTGAMAVHLESAKLNLEVMKKAMLHGDNIVYPTVGMDHAMLRRFIDLAKTEGYDIHLHMNELHPEKATQRAIARFNETGRFVDPDYVLNKVGLRPAENYSNIKNYEHVSTYRHFNNDVPKGERPILVEQGTNGTPSLGGNKEPGRLRGSADGGGIGGGRSLKKVSGEEVKAPASKKLSPTNIDQLHRMLDREQRSLAHAKENPIGHEKAYGPGKIQEYEKKIAELKQRIIQATKATEGVPVRSIQPESTSVLVRNDKKIQQASIQDSGSEIHVQLGEASKKMGLQPEQEKLQQARQNLARLVESPHSSELPTKEGSPVPTEVVSYKRSLTQVIVSKQEAKASAQAYEREMNSLQDVYNQSANEIPAGERTSAPKRQTFEELTSHIDEYHDISGFHGQARDVFRNFEKFFGKHYETAKKQILDPFDKAKGDFVDSQKKELDELKSYIIDDLGIKQGSRESAAVMDFGEKTITEEDLRAQFRLDQVKRIMDAEKWFRAKYDDLLVRVNDARKEIYGDVMKKKKTLDDEISVLEKQISEKEKILADKKNPRTLVFAKLKRQVQRLEDSKQKRLDLLSSDDWWRGKMIPRRKDYFHHFKEMEGIEGLKNIFETPAGIGPTLSGISEFTKPFSRYLPFAQKRMGNSTKHDAVAGLLHYIPSYSYAVHLDPQIPKFRKLAEELAAQSETTGSKGANNMIEFLQDYANDLAGKSNPADRYVQKVIGRKTMSFVNWVNSRVKANTILGNVSSSIAQAFNVPNGIGSAKFYSIPGATRTMANIFVESEAMAKSTFIKERYASSMYDKFDTKMLAKAKNFAVWMTGVLDEVGTKFIWNSHYAKAVGQNLSNPISYADHMTRRLVAGRGIGEVPLIHKSKVFQIFAPFQLEVGNLWYVMGDMVSTKDFSGLATLIVANYLMNDVAEKLRGSRVTFDPINAMYEGIVSLENERDKVKGSGKLVGRLTGEVLSNLPLGQTLASLYPEYGFPTKLGNSNLTRKDFFGKANPSRFGDGLLIAKGFQDPLFKIAPDFGGAQIEKTISGLQAYYAGRDTTATGKTRFRIDQTPENLIRSALFGKSSLPEAQAYYDKQSGGSTSKKGFGKLKPLPKLPKLKPLPKFPKMKKLPKLKPLP